MNIGICAKKDEGNRLDRIVLRKMYGWWESCISAVTWGLRSSFALALCHGCSILAPLIELKWCLGENFFANQVSSQSDFLCFNTQSYYRIFGNSGTCATIFLITPWGVPLQRFRVCHYFFNHVVKCQLRRILQPH